MANPTAGPYGTTATIVSATGTDANPLTGTTTDITGTGHTAFRRVSNQIAPGGPATSQSYFSTLGTVGPDCEIWSQVLAQGANGDYIYFVLRITSPGAGVTFYETGVTFATGTDGEDVYRDNAGTATGPFGAVTVEMPANAWFAAACRTSGANVVVEMFKWDGTSSWGTAIVSYTDTSPTTAMKTAGYLGLEGAGNSILRLGDIFGGTIPAATGKAPPPVWGTRRRLDARRVR